MRKIKYALLSGLALVVLQSGTAQAHDNDKSCFFQKAGSGTIKICSESGGVYEFNLRSSRDDHQEKRGDRNRNYGWNDKSYDHHHPPVYYQPVVVYRYVEVPEKRRHHKEKKNHRYNNHGHYPHR
ncbi:MAG: hypothetical protein CO093_01545 [Alphaproteobacteria bacterium CG_4_9_14_3_um_filter_47_13]|nr:MAG: hypothetical protein CO093_01545 [Alphaproteobacteria bacterium CG_4_9_14_3_um_filter_47_13]